MTQHNTSVNRPSQELTKYQVAKTQQNADQWLQDIVLILFPTIVWGIEHSHLYLYGAPFNLYMDHKPLEVIFGKPDISSTSSY